jgi:type I restriction enzyme S subunit
MTQWRLEKLGTLADFKNGLNFSAESWGRGLKIIGVSDFGDRIFPDYDSLDEINPSGVAREQDMLEEDDILFVRSNGNRQLIGRCMHIRGLREPVSHSGFTIRLRFKRAADVHVPFYVYLFRSDLIRQVLSDFGGGTNINNLNQGILENLSVPVPQREEQRKIAAILSAYDDLIANNQRRIALLEGMAEEIYREWFVRMRFPGAANVEVEKGVPSGWSLVPTIEAFKYHGGATPAKDVPRYWNEGSVHWYTPTDITGAEGMFIEASSEKCTEEGLESCSATLFPAYTVMMTSRATIGAIGINLEPACTNQGFIACLPNERYPLTFLYHWLKSAKPHFELLSGGSTFPELTKGTFKRIKVLTPPSSLMQRFDATVKPLFAQIETLIRANRRLKETRDALLPRLISGKLKVDHLDIRLPPSMRAEAEAVA